MTTDVATYSLIGIIIIEKLLSHLKSRGIDLRIMARQLDDLHEWHRPEYPNQPGIKIWWGSLELPAAINELSICLEKQATILEKTIKHLEYIERQVTKTDKVPSEF